jgi:AsmA protein
MKYKKTAIVAGFVIILAILFRGAFAQFYHDKLRQIAVAELDKSIAVPFSFSGIDFSVFRNWPNVTGSFENLTLTGNDYFLNDTIAYVKEAHFEVNLKKLIFDNQIDIESFHLEAPQVKIIEMGDENNYSIFKTDSASSDTSALNLQLNLVTVEHGNIRYIDPVSGMDIQCRDIKYTGQGKFDQISNEVMSKINMGSFSVTQNQERMLSNNRIDGDIQVKYFPKENKLAFEQSRVSIDNFNLLWKGDLVMQPTGYQINMSFESGQTTFKDIFTLFPSIALEDMKHITASGDFKLGGTVNGLYSDSLNQIPNFDVVMKVTDGAFKLDTLALPVKDIDIDLALQNVTGQWLDTKIDFKAFHAELGKYPLRGRFKLEGFTDPIIDADIISKIQLDDLERIFPIQGVDMKGLLGFEFTARGKWSHRFFEEPKKGEEAKVPPFKVFMQLANGSFKYEHLNESFKDAQFKLVATNKTGLPDDTQIALSDMKVNLNSGALSGDVSLSNLLKPVIKANILADVDMGKLKDIMPLSGYELNGNLNLQVKADGLYDQVKGRFPSVDARLFVKNGFMKSPDHPEPVKNISLSAELVNETGQLADSKLKINQSDFLFEDEPISLKGSILNFKDFAYDLFFDGKFNLESLSNIYPIEDISMQGIVDAHVELKGSLPDIQQRAFKKLKADGKVDLQMFVLSTKTIPAALVINDAQLKIDPEKIVLRRLVGQAGKASIQMRGFIHHYMAFLATDNQIVSADLAVKCDTLDLGFWLSEPAHITDTTKTKVVPWLIPKNFDFTLDVKAAVLKHPSLSVSDFDSDVVLKNGILKLNRANFTLAGGRFGLSGDYNPYVGLQPFFDFIITVQDFDIQTAYNECSLIHEMAPAIENTEGIFSGRYVLQGYLGNDLVPLSETIKGEGEIRIGNAKVNGMKMFERLSTAAKREGINDPHLKDIVIKTEIKDNHLTVKPFSMKVSGFNTEIEGIHSFNGILNYIVRIELLPIERLKIPFHVTGPYDDPKVALGKGHTLPEELQ